MHQNEEYKLRLAYSSIIRGFSIHSYKEEHVYVKHFSPLDNLEIDFLYKEHYDKAATKGYPTEQNRLKQLQEDQLWMDSDENYIKNLGVSINNLKMTKKKVFLRRDVEAINSQIQEEDNLLKVSLFKRKALIGSTVEKFAQRNVDAFLIRQSFFKDIGLTQLIYTQGVFDELEPSEINELFAIYNKIMEDFTEWNIKKIALAFFFQNAFSLSNSVYEFYGKPVCYLTNFQIQLSAYGNYYKGILNSEMKPSEELLQDPEKLEDWFVSKTNVDQMLNKTSKDGDGAVSIMGATPEDLKNWGYEEHESPLIKATREAGGELSMEEMMKLEGVK